MNSHDRETMNYNLTERQQDLLSWIVQQVREGNLGEEFHVSWYMGGFDLHPYTGDDNDRPEFSRGALDALEASGVLLIERRTRVSRGGSIYESSRDCVLQGSAYEAVDSDFAAPDTSFVTQLTPLSDVTNLDEELKSRCLPILGAGSADPKLWDSAVRTEGVILEERLRDVGGITDQSRVGRALVNDVFGQSGTLAGEFAQDSERQGYRDLYAGVVGALRNPYAHRLIDPTPEDGGASIVFVNLLLEMLEDLR
jgi:hypothetical protein